MDEKQDQQSLRKLRIDTLLWSLLGFASLSSCIYGFFRELTPAAILKSSALMLILTVYLIATLWKDLPLNRSELAGILYPDLGLANTITFIRGWLVVLLAGFVFYPFENVRFEWVPGILFLTISILDFSDGIIARLSGRVTLLGEQLDMRLDGAGVLFGSIILVMTGRAPVFFVIAGAVRYLYVFGQWLLKRNGNSVHPLPSNPYRRALAGVMMGFISITLFPFFSATVTAATSILFLIPFLIGFGQDWLYTSGVISPDNGIKLPQGKMSDLVLLLLRIAAGGFLIFSPVFPTYPSNIAGFMVSLLAIIGLFPRLNALGILVYTGTLLRLHGTDPMLWTALVLSCVSFFLGGGNLAIWAPEDRLVFHRVGEKG